MRRLVHGIENVTVYLDEHSDVSQEIEQKLLVALQSNNSAEEMPEDVADFRVDEDGVILED